MGGIWLRQFAVIYWGYRILRHKEGLGYGDVKFLAALVPGCLASFLPRLCFPCCLIRLRSRSCWSALEGRRTSRIKKPVALVGAFLGFLARVSLLVGIVLLAGR